MSTNILTGMLRDSSILQGIGPAHLDKLASNAEVRDYAPSEVVFREGDRAENAYFIISGKLWLELAPSTVYSKHLVEILPGEMVGWSSLVDHEPYAATAIAVEPARLVKIRGDVLQAMCKEDMQFGYEITRRLMMALAKRLKATWNQLAHVYVTPYVPMGAEGDFSE